MFTVPARIRLDNAVAVKLQGLQALAQGETVFDLSQVQDVDSSALAVMLAWKRAALQRKIDLELLGRDGNLGSLAQLYGVQDFFYH
ncbi:MAG: STAS domain-containing protein [Burkholderiales bacterium]|jgi:phospholipid transport system transporter-binding protein|nr:STAS domain-containing protein [Burkholderiales bacterium]MCA3155175.1 STAS domain-containing protein [Burkholderiales bacterium]MCA3156202.1 STAS domain-containing protein [Burkholderiales bacterium]MCA3168853.1 STAS domain-containing protein [Burkholderiales bacterium]MCA3174451.1 STAS domain-containing protein [Burkholderiales bacterium]